MKLFLIFPLFLLTVVSSSFAQGSDKDAIESFDNYLATCPENEIRCVWFLNGSARIGMVMRIDLSSYEVHTVREVHNWAHQNAKTRDLSHSQIETLKGLIAKPPISTKGGRLKSVFLSGTKESLSRGII